MTVYQTFTLPRLGEWLSPERDWPRSKPESSAWARVREILVAPASLAWASYSSLGEIDRSCHCLSYNSHISIPKQQSKIVHTFITNKIVQDSKTLTFPYLEKLSRGPGGTTTGTAALRTNYGAENRVRQNQEMELVEALN
ncbi:hypothetical protein DEO72_LG10g3357 [Vigna unguiculata]|uniref:Uncharacterized protein n=1 Tax=Vigna unguiculata TaxID=3917 RepID=A0A4D6NEI7_VIGUN|nr:hypothetical protein DEO72_LG10g3357 [Vigna unguiculata]